jgi:predicted O-methyltransferase YrrM
MIEPSDYVARGWDVRAGFAGDAALPRDLLENMTAHPEAPGESAWGTRNVLHAFILAMRPKTVLEIGAHIGSASVVIGTALRYNGFGQSFHLEPQDHYFDLLSKHIRDAGLERTATPVKRFSTDPELANIVGGSVDIVFLDANHAYSHALEDLHIADRLLAPNGLIFLDDVATPHSGQICTEGKGGVRQALIDFATDRSTYSVIFFEPPFWLNPCGLAVACKQQVISSPQKPVVR